MTDPRILIIDDDAAALRLLEARLRRAGYEVFRAHDGSEGLQILCRQGIQMVITDWMMPGMDGLTLCKQVRSVTDIGFVYIIMLTANCDKSAIIGALEGGADDFLAKPYHEGELLARLTAGQRIIALESRLAQNVRDLHRANAELMVLNKRLDKMATTDELTGLTNRREAMCRLHEAYAMAVRYGRDLSCIMLDIDHFKALNDTYGHCAGDAVLRQVAKALQGCAREGERVCRVGGEEFLVVCPSTHLAGVRIAGERFRRRIESQECTFHDTRMGVTISVGVAQLCQGMAGPDDLIRAADEALYAAKHAGRNRVCATAATERVAVGSGSGDATTPLPGADAPDTGDLHGFVGPGASGPRQK